MANGKDVAKLAAAGVGVFVLKSIWNQLTEYDLTGKTVLITGGSRGLGLVMAREFAREGSRLVLCARDEAELQRARTDLGGEVMTVPCDLTNRPSVMEMIEQVNSR